MRCNGTILNTKKGNAIKVRTATTKDIAINTTYRKNKKPRVFDVFSCFLWTFGIFWKQIIGTDWDGYDVTLSE
jgi:hypothetical protein